MNTNERNGMQGYQKKPNAVPEKATEKASDEILAMLRRIAEFSEEVNTRVFNRLDSVTREAYLIGLTEEEKEEKEFPPLFNTLRAYLNRIDHALIDINNTIDRLEL